MYSRPEELEGSRMSDPVLAASGLFKGFGQVKALDGADFDVCAGEVVALVGDNGAGKSVLIKTLSGVLRPDSGEILFRGEPTEVSSPLVARRLGIETVYQDLALAPDLDVGANIFLGQEIRRRGILGKLGVRDDKAMARRSNEVLKSLSVNLPGSGSEVGYLSGGQRQSVAVARSVSWATSVLILDEPTAALGVVQTRRVLELVRKVADRGLAVILVSHSMPDVFAVADRIQVLRLGKRVAMLARSETSMEQVIAAMTGADR